MPCVCVFWGSPKPSVYSEYQHKHHTITMEYPKPYALCLETNSIIRVQCRMSTGNRCLPLLYRIYSAQHMCTAHDVYGCTCRQRHSPCTTLKHETTKRHRENATHHSATVPGANDEELELHLLCQVSDRGCSYGLAVARHRGVRQL